MIKFIFDNSKALIKLLSIILRDTAKTNLFCINLSNLARNVEKGVKILGQNSMYQISKNSLIWYQTSTP